MTELPEGAVQNLVATVLHLAQRRWIQSHSVAKKAGRTAIYTGMTHLNYITLPPKTHIPGTAHLYYTLIASYWVLHTYCFRVA